MYLVLTLLFVSDLERLGSTDFETREMAQQRLAMYWPVSIPAIESGMKSPDLEVRRRCRMLSTKGRCYHHFLILVKEAQATLNFVNPGEHNTSHVCISGDGRRWAEKHDMYEVVILLARYQGLVVTCWCQDDDCHISCRRENRKRGN